MKLSISNIAWPTEWDEEIYFAMQEWGYTGLEIAPTRIFPEDPYENLSKVSDWYEGMRDRFVIPSMQSIWFGRSEKIFGTEEEREILLNYTKKAIDFAERIECKNLVFGCPRNRVISDKGDQAIAVDFFSELGAYAQAHHTVIGMEPNPPIYNTNFLNTTSETIDFIETVNSSGLKLNVDVGAMIENEESLGCLAGKEGLIHHVHISEPGLKRILNRRIHGQLGDFLRACGYQGYVSIEMGKQESVDSVVGVMKYVREQME